MANYQDTAEDYWERRKNYVYYQVARILTDQIGKDAYSIIDVGSAGSPFLDWFPQIPFRTSIDLNKPYFSSNVRSISNDFLEWSPDRHYDLVTCMQVLEHVPDASRFAKKLLSIGDVIIVSVPYKWPEGKTATHVHDPVDETKMARWFGRAPNFSYICRELLAPVERLIQVYEKFPDAWTGLNGREKVLQARKGK